MVPTTPAIGIYAPIALSTWMSTAASLAGPTMDTNQVFDQVAIVANAESSKYTLALTLPTVTAPETVNQPGDEVAVDFGFTFSFDAGVYLAAPYNIELTLASQV